MLLTFYSIFVNKTDFINLYLYTMDKSNLFRILLLSSFLTIFFSGFANSINDSKTTTKSYVLNPSSLVVPTISSQSPSTLDVCIGEPISLFVTANGNGVLNYQWQKDGVDITNATATTANLNIPASVAHLVPTE